MAISSECSLAQLVFLPKKASNPLIIMRRSWVGMSGKKSVFYNYLKWRGYNFGLELSKHNTLNMYDLSSTSVRTTLIGIIVTFLFPILLIAQAPSHIDLRVQLRFNEAPRRHMALDLEVALYEENRLVFLEMHEGVWVNYDGYIDIRMGIKNPTDWKAIDWSAATKTIKIKRRQRSISDPIPFGVNQYLYEGGLPTAAYAQIIKPYERPGIGLISLFSFSSNPNIELRGNDAVNNYPLIDFATNEAQGYVARLRIHSDDNFYVYSKAGGTVFRKWPTSASQVDIGAHNDARIRLRGGAPHINFYSSNASSAALDGQIKFEDNRFSIRSNGKEMLLSTELTNGRYAPMSFYASEYNFDGGHINSPLILRSSAQLDTIKNHLEMIDYWSGRPEGTLGNGAQYWTYHEENSNHNYSLLAEDAIVSKTGFIVASDVRVKKNIDVIKNHDFFDRFKKLEVVSYQPKDIFYNGPQFKIGFIAQDVEKIIPNTITYTKEVVPDILQLANVLHYDSTSKRITLDFSNILSEASILEGEKIKLIGAKSHLLEVFQIQGKEVTFINWPEEYTAELFVYGKEVDDYRALDYDQIFTLNVAVTQALIKQTEALQTQVQDLQHANEQAEIENEKLRLQVNGIEAKLDALLGELHPKPVPATSSTGEEK